jgi:hypothetical protein
MSDVNVSVNVDGKTVFVHGVAGSPDACIAAVTGLQAGLDHFRAINAQSAPPAAGQSVQAGNLSYGQNALNQKGPSL